jgi:hypothetical protein
MSLANGAFEATPEQDAIVDKVVALIHRFGLVTPAIVALESVRPLNFIGSQFMHVTSPIAALVLVRGQWDVIAGMLEDRRSVEYLICKLEAPRPDAVTP